MVFKVFGLLEFTSGSPSYECMYIKKKHVRSPDVFKNSEHLLHFLNFQRRWKQKIIDFLKFHFFFKNGLNENKRMPEETKS